MNLKYQLHDVLVFADSYLICLAYIKKGCILVKNKSLNHTILSIDFENNIHDMKRLNKPTCQIPQIILFWDIELSALRSISSQSQINNEIIK